MIAKSASELIEICKTENIKSSEYAINLEIEQKDI